MPAADNQTIGDVEYQFNASTETYTVADVPSPTSDVALLAMVDGYPVTSIDANAFKGCSKLSSVSIEGEGLETIGSKAFMECSSLTEITIPRSVTAIALNYQQSYCPPKLNQIVDNAFSGSNALKRVILFGAPAEFTQSNTTASTKSLYDIFGSSANFYVPSSLAVQYIEGVTKWASAALQIYSFSMTISPDEVLSLAVGKSQKLTAGLNVKPHSSDEEIVVPEFSTILDQAIWTSGNNSVATVSADGTVTGIREGTTAIQVETPSDSALRADVVFTTPLPQYRLSEPHL